MCGGHESVPLRSPIAKRVIDRGLHQEPLKPIAMFV